MHTNKNIVLLLTVALALSSCSSQYHLADIQRTRILVDSRYDAHPDAEAAAFMKPYKQKVDSVMSPVVGYIARDMTVYQPESEESNLLADILLWASDSLYGEKCDFGVYNMGGIRASFTKGAVTFGDVVDVAPFENKICFLTLKGSDVIDLFKQMAHQGGQGVSRGVNIVISRDGKLLSAKVHGKDVDPNADYRITTIDYLAQGNDNLDAFKKKTNFVSPQDKSYDARYVIIRYFRYKTAKGEQVDSHIENRTVVK